MSTRETAAVRRAASRFYDALNVMFAGELGPMEDVWSHRADVSYLGPGGDLRIGWDDVLASWKEQAALKLGGNVEPADVHVMAGGDIAIVQNREVGENHHANGRRHTVSIRATNVFRKEDGVWKMISHHADRLSFIPE